MPEHAVPPDWQAITDLAGTTAYHLTQQIAEALRALSTALARIGRRARPGATPTDTG